MTPTFTKAEIAILDKPGSGETNTPLTSSFDPVALYSDGKVAGIFNKPQSINDGFFLAVADTSTQSKYQIERNDAGRPTAVKDSHGNRRYSISYDEKGAVKEVRFENREELNGILSPQFLRPCSDGWEWYDVNNRLLTTTRGTFSIDNGANINFKPACGLPYRWEPDGSEEEVPTSRESWHEPYTYTRIVRLDNGFEVHDKNGKPLRKVIVDKDGIVSVEDGDGTSWTRNADGKSWNHNRFKHTYFGTAYNLKIDRKGNISYEQNRFGRPDKDTSKPKSPFWDRRELVTEYIDGRVRTSPQ